MNAETAYLFRHALTRDAAHQLQLPVDRSRLHALAFAVIEDFAGGRPCAVDGRLGKPRPRPLRPGAGSVSRGGRPAHRCESALLDVAEHRLEDARAGWRQGLAILRTLGDLVAMRSLEASMRAVCSRAGIPPFDPDPA